MAKLRAAYPHAADKIILGGPIEAEDVYARASRVAVAQGLPSTQPSDALYNLVTFTRTWIRPWAFYAIEDAQRAPSCSRFFPMAATWHLRAKPIANRATKRWTITGA